MLLSALLVDRQAAGMPRIIGDPDLDIAGLAVDSRKVRPGDLFVALDGAHHDGAAFVDDALAKGAVAVLGKPALAERVWPVPLILDDNPRRRLALMAARYYALQPRTVAAVTGTNGKTSIAHYTRALWQKLGHRAASLGTLGLEADGLLPSPGLTTPEPVTLHRQLRELAEHGIEHLAIEASSHGLAQHRVDGVAIKAAAFSHISRDHYDYHGSYEAYFAAKRRLFAEILPADGIAVFNADVPEFAELAEIVSGRGGEVLEYGRNARKLRLDGVTATPEGLTIAVSIETQSVSFDVPLIGSFQAHNLLAAMGLVMATGGERDDVLAAVADLRAPRGRMEHVGAHPSGAALIVDYAHTPDALATALQALRAHTPERLHVVFGCGGDRDPGKRPMMGEAAARYADRVYVTDDNPRTEDAARIRAETMAGCPEAIEIGDRAEAIAAAFAALAPGDLLLVAGKGHETGQIVGDTVLPFDDAQTLRALAAGATGTAGAA